MHASQSLLIFLMIEFRSSYRGLVNPNSNTRDKSLIEEM